MVPTDRFHGTMMMSIPKEVVEKGSILAAWLMSELTPLYPDWYENVTDPPWLVTIMNGASRTEGPRATEPWRPAWIPPSKIAAVAVAVVRAAQEPERVQPRYGVDMLREPKLRLGPANMTRLPPGLWIGWSSRLKLMGINSPPSVASPTSCGKKKFPL